LVVVSVVGAHVLIDAVRLGDESTLEDDASLLVPLVLLGGKLVYPANFGIAIFAKDVTHHVPPGQHHTVLHVTGNKS
jgi:hypothetical protein